MLRSLLQEMRSELREAGNRFHDDVERANYELDPTTLAGHHNHLEAAENAVKAMEKLMRLGSFSTHFYPEEQRAIEEAVQRIKASMLPMAVLRQKEKKPILRLR